MKIVFHLLVSTFFIIATLSVVMSALGIQPYLTNKGMDYTSLILCTVWFLESVHFTSSFSKMAKWMMGSK